MTIRRASDHDEPLLRELWEAFTAEATFTPYPGAPFEPSLVRDHVALLAEDGGDVAGTVYANVASPWFGYVFGLYVRPERRRRGIATALMREIATVVQQEGRQYVVLSVDTPNAAARTFY